MGLCDIGSSLADAIGTALLYIRPSPSPREASRNDSLAILRTRFIVTGRLPPVRAETRGDAAPSVYVLVVPAAALGRGRPDRLVLRPLEPLDVLAALVLVPQVAALPGHIERFAPALVQGNQEVGAGVAVGHHEVRVGHLLARRGGRREVVAAAHGSRGTAGAAG